MLFRIAVAEILSGVSCAQVTKHRDYHVLRNDPEL